MWDMNLRPSDYITGALPTEIYIQSYIYSNYVIVLSININ